MYQVKSLFFKMVASVFAVASLYACDSVEDKKEANEEVQDVDKTEMMEEEHQMDPMEGDMMKENQEDSAQ